LSGLCGVNARAISNYYPDGRRFECLLLGKNNLTLYDRH
jgi:hypothetical protein